MSDELDERVETALMGIKLSGLDAVRYPENEEIRAALKEGLEQGACSWSDILAAQRHYVTFQIGYNFKLAGVLGKESGQVRQKWLKRGIKRGFFTEEELEAQYQKSERTYQGWASKMGYNPEDDLTRKKYERYFTAFFKEAMLSGRKSDRNPPFLLD